ncbi:MAG TPA: glycosyltransferase [Gordonia polyisoprenivorans]|uniref:glycosyltransferase n=1 Tax=Gordonia polyisoprenivorans TaxID=84595 RepID=UPI0003648DFF|nr:nucleotide disphospho-sugar-binding domain-containing protein [Gordonia polyisoprenivorans]QUD83429.1 glycosyltransferase [Gordonia polyisoprenivorans]HCS57108.1 glycosyltransferase [Gordonia polyisoprenivorans]
MRIAFALHGSRGDVQPAAAVAAELVRRGHSVRLAVAADLVESFARTMIPTTELCPSTADLLASPLIRNDLKSRNPRTRFRALREVSAYGVEQSERVMAELADESDVLVTGLLAQDRAATIAESRGIAFVPLHYCPVRVSGSVSPVYRDVPQLVSRVAWTLADRVMWRSTRGADRRLRARLGLPPDRRPFSRRLRADGIPEIQVYDPVLFPDLPREWGSQRPFVGFLCPDKEIRTAINDGLDRTDAAIGFACSGPPPVYVGFGSMRTPVDRMEFVVTTLLDRGLRVIAHTDLDLPITDSRLFRVSGTVDHEALLPHCRAAVHHGGAGTTGSVLRAGIPSAVGWFSADQPIWAAALRRCGAGTGSRLSQMSADDLSVLTDPGAQAAARRIAERLLPPHHAVDVACDIITTAAASTT